MSLHQQVLDFFGGGADGQPLNHHLPYLLLAFLAVAVLPGVPSRACAAEASGVSDALQPFVDHHELAGAVTVVATGDEVLSLEAVGYADVEAKAPLPVDALFWIASQSKPMTATALMMLVDEGEVGLDDPVAQYLPEFGGLKVRVAEDGAPPVLTDPARLITVRNLLTHTSGLPFSSPEEQPTLDLLPLREAVSSYAKLALEFEPGTKYQYSNAGINTAGRIIELVSGMPYEEFLQKRLFDPLGMKDTTFWPDDEQVARLAKSYKPNETGDDLLETTIMQLRYPLTDRARRYPMPAGGLFSTAADVMRFCRMILNGGELDGTRYLSEAAVEQMTSRQTPAELPESYGFGWAAGDGWCGHAGAYATNMAIDKRRGLITVFMVQHAGFPGEGGKSQEAFQQAARERFATAADARGPTVWMAPPGHDDGKCVRELFERPEEWRETRELIDGLLYADHNLNRQFTDDELREWFGLLGQWGIKLELEVGAIKEWGQTGEATFAAQQPAWQRFQGLGATIHSIALDEPLLCCRHYIDKPDDYAVEETASFIALVRQHFPEVLIGDIETYPSIPLADHFWWIEALNKRLAEKGARGLDFYRLDVNWAEFVAFNLGGWPEVRDLEHWCRERGLPFSLIYWASTYPVMRQKGLADDSTWYVSIMQQGYDYALVDGAPDEYVIESWLGAPDRSVPETDEFTFTRSVRDFVRRFVGRQSAASR